MMPEGSQGTNIQRIFVGTNRGKLENGSYGSDRGTDLQFAHVDISIPTDRTYGEINWPRGAVNPSKDFLTQEFINYGSNAAFEANLKRDIRNSNSQSGDVYVYVHGYNNNFSESLYRAAQTKSDYGIQEPLVHFSWPSAGSSLAYIKDRDSVLASRTIFESFLRSVKRAGAENIVIMAHSLGTQLTMETYRQVALTDPSAKSELFGTVILLAPDIDVDVFRSQLTDIGSVDTPILVFGTHQDKVLALSARLGGGERLGRISKVSDLNDLQVIVVDVSELTDGKQGDHMTVLASEDAIDAFGKLYGVSEDIETDEFERIGIVPGIILSIQNFSNQLYSFAED
ncbi:MAG: alpha/beta hydrolase [Pseudoruegeria sp.]